MYSQDLRVIVTDLWLYYMQAVFKWRPYVSFAEANFICNNNNFEGKFAIHFILQIITISIKQQEGTTILEVTNPSHHNNSMNTCSYHPCQVLRF